MEILILLITGPMFVYILFDGAKQGITWIRKKTMKATMDVAMSYAGRPVVFPPECDPREYLVDKQRCAANEWSVAFPGITKGGFDGNQMSQMLGTASRGRVQQGETASVHGV